MTSFHRSRGPLWGAPEVAIAAMALQGKEGSGKIQEVLRVASG